MEFILKALLIITGLILGIFLIFGTNWLLTYGILWVIQGIWDINYWDKFWYVFWGIYILLIILKLWRK